MIAWLKYIDNQIAAHEQQVGLSATHIGPTPSPNCSTTPTGRGRPHVTPGPTHANSGSSCQPK